jgi:hypothetical protein
MPMANVGIHRTLACSSWAAATRIFSAAATTSIGRAFANVKAVGKLIGRGLSSTATTGTCGSLGPVFPKLTSFVSPRAIGLPIADAGTIEGFDGAGKLG